MPFRAMKTHYINKCFEKIHTGMLFSCTELGNFTIRDVAKTSDNGLHLRLNFTHLDNYIPASK